MSTNWQLLDLSQTTDLKKIKSAYASKLKTTRPDEKPEEFQQLHQAYKQAISYAKQVLFEQSEQINITDENSQEQSVANIVEKDGNGVEESVEKMDAEQLEHQAFVDKEYTNLVEHFNSVLADKNKRNDKGEWQFLTQSPLILDPQVNAQLGLFVFNAIDQHNLAIKAPSASTRRGRKRNYSEPNAKVNDRIIKYLDTIFNWSGEVSMLHYYLGDEPCNRLFPILNARDFSDQQAAINSVKGGEVYKQKQKASAIEEYHFAVEAYSRVVSLFNYVVFVVFIVLITFMHRWIKVNEFLAYSLVGCLVFYMIVQWYSLRKQMKFAAKLMWGGASILLFLFPFGTILGALLMTNLYKSRKFHDF